MKNSIFIDVDTEREHIVQFAKTEEQKPTTEEEKKTLLFNDFETVLTGLGILIAACDSSGIATRKELVGECIQQLNLLLKGKDEKEN